MKIRQVRKADSKNKDVALWALRLGCRSLVHRSSIVFHRSSVVNSTTEVGRVRQKLGRVRQKRNRSVTLTLTLFTTNLPLDFAKTQNIKIVH